ncbi:MAG: leucyl aminopeptidase, partial [bacterium]|nr:leucyl aminopeptidase [bacterium]
LKNVETNRGPGTITAFAFLEAFVDEDVPFAHLDVASTASKGDEVTGRPVSLLVQFLLNRTL